MDNLFGGVYSSRDIAEELGLEVKSVSTNAKRWGLGRKMGGVYVFTDEERRIFKRKHRRNYAKRANRQAGEPTVSFGGFE